ncbi:MAG: translation initiation factor IF-2 [Candidatus Woesearchaeota archaeon]
MITRSPICTVVGHVDHGKSSILDQVRGSNIVSKEAGAITQAIGASIVPIETIKKICGSLLDKIKIDFTIPGLLFIDTPGHEAFTNLRKRGGNLADIAVLVIDINEGMKPQTIEALEILKNYKTPFIIALNKIDLIAGWKSDNKKNLLENLNSQNDETKRKFETRFYEIIGELSERGMNSERFDRIDDYTKNIAIVPCSAKTNEGIPEILMVIAGLAQRFLNQCLSCDVDMNGKGTVLEVKEEKGLGTTIDVILYDGHLKVNDTIVIGTLNEPIVTKIRALLEPLPLSELRDKKSKFHSEKGVYAATGIKIAAPNLEGVVSGMPIRSCETSDIDSVKEAIKEEVEEVIIETDKDGVIVKADALGSLEALTKLLRDEGVPIRKATIGEISKADISEAESNYEEDPLHACVLGFNIKEPNFPAPENIKIITSPVIYSIIESYKEWRDEQQKKEEEKGLEQLTRPCKFTVMPQYIFRQSNPAIFGADITSGVMTTGMPVMKKGIHVGKIKSIEEKQENKSRTEAPAEVAVSMEHVTIGRQIEPGDELYSDIPEDQFRKLKEFKKLLKPAEIEVLKEIARIKREENPVWGI